MNRPVSPNLSDQKDEGTCYAHSLARVVVNAIRQTIPEYFYPSSQETPLNNDKCNEIYSVDIFNDVSRYIEEHNCNTKSANNLLLFSYVYNSITSRYGCDGGEPVPVLEWCVNYLKTDFGLESEILNALPTLSVRDLNKLHSLCQAFLVRFYGEQTNDFIIGSMKITIRDLSFLQFILDNGYYICFISDRHVVTSVGHRQHFEHLLLIFKNSHGKITTYDTELKAPIHNGILSMTLNKMVDAGFDRVVYILPNIFPDDLHRVKHRRVMNQLKERRQSRNEASRRTSGKTRGGKKCRGKSGNFVSIRTRRRRHQ